MAAIEQAIKFLDPKTVALVSNYRLMARLMIDGYFMGQHRGPRHAFSLEYSRHREYYPGDPLKLVDWKLYGKSDRYFVKQYEEETNLAAWLVMDISKSMGYQGSRGGVSKMHYACYLAAAISYLLLGQKDLVGLVTFDEQLRKIIKPSSASSQLNIILKELHQLKEGGVSHFVDSAKLVASRIKKRGLIVLFSDLLGQPEEIERTLKTFLHKGSELIVFHTLSFDEMEFPFKRFGYFEDLETKNRVLLQPSFFKEEYIKRIKEYLKAVKQICRKLKVTYQLLQTTTPYDRALTVFLQARSKMN